MKKLLILTLIGSGILSQSLSATTVANAKETANKFVDSMSIHEINCSKDNSCDHVMEVYSSTLAYILEELFKNDSLSSIRNNAVFAVEDASKKLA